MSLSPPPFLDAVRDRGFCFVEADVMRAWLEDEGSLGDWGPFVDSWNRLEPDRYLAQLGKQRRRRHAVFRLEHGVEGARVQPCPHQPHYQSLAYNTLQGDIERWFEPIEASVAQGESLKAILRHCHALFASLAPGVAAWHAEVHQFRIEAQADVPGQPTPEGMHRDGVDYVLVLMVDRENVARGTTRIHDMQGREVGAFTLARAFDAALVDDARVFHGVTPVEALDPALPSHRDVLVVTLRDADRTPDPGLQPR
ncbi:2OG-Fe dioxygenase family protein [Lysobacter sp. SG-8]|uniref:2OG-Fe dioxygenase family protein n=1 Tax=Marilutibacter penaei TaxID=2759900 RepID=A0A7W3U1G4_9GAMM|nr:2OG-Fe dioxygenase family protein [Lysobacter penaei]MBB1087221.1 2OG-Fe dioxygenase family protein [Lysobacter penaei]